MKVKEESEKAGLKQHSKNEDHGIQSHYFMANRWGNNGNCDRLYFLGLQNHCRWWLQPQNKNVLAPWKESYDKPRQCIKKQTNLDSILQSRDITLPTKVYIVRAMVFSVDMYGCESWTIEKAEHWRIDAFKLWCWRKTLESPLDCKEIKPVNCKGNQSWIFVGRTDAEAEASILWPADAKSRLTGKDWCWESLKAKEGSGRDG